MKKKLGKFLESQISKISNIPPGSVNVTKGKKTIPMFPKSILTKNAIH